MRQRGGAGISYGFRAHPLLRTIATLAVCGITLALQCSAPSSASSEVFPSSSSTLARTGLTPVGITLDSAGNIYTANSGSNTVTKITRGGTATTLASTGTKPRGIAIDSAGSIFTSNYGSNNVTKITPDGKATRDFALTASQPYAITIDSNDNLYTANYGSNDVTKITSLTSEHGKTEVLGGTLAKPYAITVDANGNVYTANADSWSVTKITPGGTATKLASTGDRSRPAGIAADPEGNIYTANTDFGTVTKITPDGTATTLASTGTHPYGITFDSNRNLYTANRLSNNVTKITPDGTATTLASTGDRPYGITIDSAGNIYTANGGTAPADGTVTKITPDGNVAPAPPARPDAPTASAGVSTTAVVKVPANPVSAAYAAPASYLVTAEKDQSKQCTVTGASGSCTVTGLTYGTSYTFTAQAKLNKWTTAASSPSNAVTPTEVPSRPPAPTAKLLNDWKSAKVTVSAGVGAAPTSYSVTAVNDRSKQCTVTGALGSCTVTGLKQGTSYTFTATAKKGGHDSPASPASKPVGAILAANSIPRRQLVAVMVGKRLLKRSYWQIEVSEGLFKRIVKGAVKVRSRCRNSSSKRWSKACKIRSRKENKLKLGRLGTIRKGTTHELRLSQKGMTTVVCTKRGTRGAEMDCRPQK